MSRERGDARNTRRTTATIAPSSPALGSLRGRRDSSDWYAFAGVEGGVYTFTAEGRGNFDPVVILRDARGEELFRSEDPVDGTAEITEIDLDESGLYFIDVQGHASSRGAYRVDMEADIPDEVASSLPSRLRRLVQGDSEDVGSRAPMISINLINQVSNRVEAEGGAGGAGGSVGDIDNSSSSSADANADADADADARNTNQNANRNQGFGGPGGGGPGGRGPGGGGPGGGGPGGGGPGGRRKEFTLAGQNNPYLNLSRIAGITGQVTGNDEDGRSLISALAAPQPGNPFLGDSLLA